MHNISNKGLNEEDKKGLLKRLKNIGYKNEEQLKATKNNETIKEVTNFVEEPLRQEAKELIEETRVIQKDVDYSKLKVTRVN